MDDLLEPDIYNITNKDGDLISTGDKVICRGNEPDPLIIGKVIGFCILGKNKTSAPVVVIERNYDKKEFMILGITKPFSKNLLETLYPMKTLEQWNYLIRNYDWMNPLNEKYGRTYKTFESDKQNTGDS